MNRNRFLRYVAVLFIVVVLISGLLFGVLPASQAGTTDLSPVGTTSAETYDAANVLSQSDPNEPPHGQEIANYSSGNQSIDVSNRDWVYVEVYGEPGQSQTTAEDELFGGNGGYASGYVDVSRFDTTYAVLASGPNGYIDGVPGESGFTGRTSGGGGGLTALVSQNQRLIEAGGGGGGGGTDGTYLGGFGAVGEGAGTCSGTNGNPLNQYSGGIGGFCGTQGPNGQGGIGAWNQSITAFTYAERNVSTDSRIVVYENANYTPSITNANPTNGTQTSNTQELSVSISDRDFAHVWSDRITVEFRDGQTNNLIDSSTVYQNTTVSATDSVEPGVNSWYVEVNDSYGHSLTSATYSYQGPSNVSVYSEENNTQLLTGTNVEAELYGENGQIYTRNTTTGEFSIASLPEQTYFVQVSANGYESRTTYIDNVYESHSVYLLDNATQTITAQFVLEDTTGTYTTDARLVLERPISNNGDSSYETIVYDTFGTEGITTQLEQGIRYRLSIERENGERQLLGPYRAEISETVTVSPSSGVISIDSQGTWAAGASYSDQNVIARFVTGETDVSSVSITVHERGNESNTLVVDDTYTNVDDLQVSYAVPQQYNESSWRVEIDVSSNDQTESVSYLVGPSPNVVPAKLDPLWRQIIAVAILISFGMGFSVLNKAVGGISVAVVGGILFWVGWLEGATVGAAITLYLFLAVMYAVFEKTIR